MFSPRGHTTRTFPWACSVSSSFLRSHHLSRGDSLQIGDIVGKIARIRTSEKLPQPFFLLDLSTTGSSVRDLTPLDLDLVKKRNRFFWGSGFDLIRSVKFLKRFRYSIPRNPNRSKVSGCPIDLLA